MISQLDPPCCFSVMIFFNPRQFGCQVIQVLTIFCKQHFSWLRVHVTYDHINIFDSYKLYHAFATQLPKSFFEISSHLIHLLFHI